MEKRTCIDCGRALVDYVRGRPALRCGECKRGRRRIKERADVTCVDCGEVFKPPGHTGLPPERCAPCRAQRKREVDSAKSKAWREANPERQRAASRKHHEKRSEEHTSELQSLMRTSYAVFCLKKKNKTMTHTTR